MIIQAKEGDTLHIRFEGRLDVNTAEPDERKIMDQLSGIKFIIVDCKNLAYVSSAGLRMLVSLQKRLSTKGGDLKLLKVSDAVMDIFEMTGFADILTIEKA